MIIDADAHYTPPPRVFDHPDIQEWYLDYRDRKQSSYTDIDQRRQEFAQLGIDHQVLNFMGISLNMNYRLAPATGVRVMQIYNQHMQDICQNHSGFSATAWLALQDLPASLQELQLRSQQDFFAAFISDTPPWGFMPEYDVLFARLQELDMPAYLHQTEVTDVIKTSHGSWDTDLARLQAVWPAQNFWKRTMASLIIGGILDRYPRLKIIVAERDIDWIGEFTQTLLDLGYPDPAPYLRRNFWFTTEPEMPGFVGTASDLGWNRMLFATDWPHDRDMGGANARYDVATVKDLPIGDMEKDLLFAKNFQSLIR